ncbi:MAG: hypothetical protein ABMA13_18225 [Chthoniobacteraceae bacterium]
MITGRCHVCKEVRAESQLATERRTARSPRGASISIGIMYCRDRGGCLCRAGVLADERIAKIVADLEAAKGASA